MQASLFIVFIQELSREDAMDRARVSLESGRAMNALNKLVQKNI